MSNGSVQVIVLVLAALFAPVRGARAPTPIARLQHEIEDVSARVQVALGDLASARTADEKRRADATLVDLRLELADLSDRVERERLQSLR